MVWAVCIHVQYGLICRVLKGTNVWKVITVWAFSNCAVFGPLNVHTVTTVSILCTVCTIYVYILYWLSILTVYFIYIHVYREEILMNSLWDEIGPKVLAEIYVEAAERNSSEWATCIIQQKQNYMLHNLKSNVLFLIDPFLYFPQWIQHSCRHWTT